MIIEVNSANEMQTLGMRLGQQLSGGLAIELIGDVGAGKTTLTKGVARGLDIDEAVQSPTFTLSRLYGGRDGLHLAHYDFYRLNDAGIMKDEIAETLQDTQTITVVEWGDVVAGVLPDDRLTITIIAKSEDARQLELSASGNKSRRLLEALA